MDPSSARINFEFRLWFRYRMSGGSKIDTLVHFGVVERTVRCASKKQIAAAQVIGLSKCHKISTLVRATPRSGIGFRRASSYANLGFDVPLSDCESSNRFAGVIVREGHWPRSEIKNQRLENSPHKAINRAWLRPRHRESREFSSSRFPVLPPEVAIESSFESHPGIPTDRR